MPHFRNNVIPNVHFHKDWQRYIKTWFDQPMRKKRRARARAEKGDELQRLRPVVSCPTMRYNMKKRLGRGFSVDEVRAAGMKVGFARSIGISVDPRRKNKSVESMQRNVKRLKSYRGKLILFPRKGRKPCKGEASKEEIKMAVKVKGPIMPIKKKTLRPTIRKPSEKEKKFKAYQVVRMARAKERLVGVRAKKAKEAAESLDAPKK
ncbi:ribosomal protein L13 [Brevipalpus obovatus]|uniref:ribosomal protein L13 n=1 Tax=Brevipalpus obovatus TaxID=246614 RepID=UPI003D9F8D3F